MAQTYVTTLNVATSISNKIFRIEVTHTKPVTITAPTIPPKRQRKGLFARIQHCTH